MAYILHIDTSAETGLVALSRNGVVAQSITNADTRNHAAVLNLHIEKVLADAGIGLQDLNAIAVCGGPGSYTGLRIGLATAKGLCYVLDKPLMMHHRLLLLLLEHYYKHLTAYEVYAAILNARDKEYYFASYNNKLEPIIQPGHILEDRAAEIKHILGGKTLLAGDINENIHTIFSSNDNSIINSANINIDSWAQYAFEKYDCHEFVNLAHAEPFYLKQVFTHKPKNIN